MRFEFKVSIQMNGQPHLTQICDALKRVPSKSWGCKVKGYHLDGWRFRGKIEVAQNWDESSMVDKLRELFASQFSIKELSVRVNVRHLDWTGD